MTETKNEEKKPPHTGERERGMKPFFTYYGGKYRIAPRYPRPSFNTIIEPFCGSAGYSIRYSFLKVKLFDLNPRIVGVWQYLISVKEKEIRALPEIFDDARHLSVPEEARWLIGFWCNKGTAEPRNKPSTWMKSGVRPNSQWGPAIKNRIASQLINIRHWTVTLGSYEKIENETATWFIDPPYSSKAGRLYTHNQINYSVLAEWSKERFGQKIVCEMAGASWLQFAPFYRAKGLEGPKGKKKIDEAVWIGERLLTQPQESEKP